MPVNERRRPGYPSALVDAVVEGAGLVAGDRLLEIGCGPGLATLPFAERGFHITAVEPGAEMARLARLRLRGYDVTHPEIELPETLTDSLDTYFALPEQRRLGFARAVRLVGRASDVWRVSRSRNERPSSALPYSNTTGRPASIRYVDCKMNPRGMPRS